MLFLSIPILCFSRLHANISQRRRAQVRLAQQAYRHRKEATLHSLRTESNDLRARVRHLERAFYGLFNVVERSGLTPGDHNIIQELREDVDRYRLPLDTSGEGTDAESCDFQRPESEGMKPCLWIFELSETDSKEPNPRETIFAKRMKWTVSQLPWQLTLFSMQVEERIPTQFPNPHNITSSLTK